MKISFLVLVVVSFLALVKAGFAPKPKSDYYEEYEDSIHSLTWLDKKLYDPNDYEFHQRVPELMIYYAKKGKDEFFSKFLNRASLVNWHGPVPLYKKHILSSDDLLDVARNILQVRPSTVNTKIASSFAEYGLWRLKELDKSALSESRTRVTELATLLIRFYASLGNIQPILELKSFLSNPNLELIKDAIYISIEKGYTNIILELLRWYPKSIDADEFLLHSALNEATTIVIFLANLNRFPFKDLPNTLQIALKCIAGNAPNSWIYPKFVKHPTVKSLVPHDKIRIGQEFIDSGLLGSLSYSARKKFMSDFSSDQMSTFIRALAKVPHHHLLVWEINWLFDIKPDFAEDAAQFGNWNALKEAKSLSSEAYARVVKIATEYGQVKILKQLKKAKKLKEHIMSGLSHSLDYNNVDVLEFYLDEILENKMQIPGNVIEKALSRQLSATMFMDHKTIKTLMDSISLAPLLRKLVETNNITGLQFILRNYIMTKIGKEDYEYVIDYCARFGTPKMSEFLKQERYYVVTELPKFKAIRTEERRQRIAKQAARDRFFDEAERADYFRSAHRIFM